MNKKEGSPNLLQDFVKTIVAVSAYPKFKSAVFAVVLGVVIILASMFFAKTQLKMVVSIAGMFISYSGFEQIGILIQTQQNSDAAENADDNRKGSDGHEE